MHGILTLIMVIFLVNQGVAGTWTGHNFIYKPSLGARGEIEKNTFDYGLDRVDTHLGKYKTLSDPGYETLAAALTTIGSTEVTLTIPEGTVSITGNTTIPANVHIRMLKGGRFDIANGITLTINGPFEAGPYQVFSWTGTGKVTFGDGIVSEVLPEWWGAKGDNSTDSTVAIQAAITAVETGTVKFQKGTYLISVPLIHKASLIGAGRHGFTTIKAKGGWSGNMMLDLYYGSAVYYYGLRIENIIWDANSLVSSIFGSSNDGIGHSQGFYQNLRFTGATGWAVNLHTASTSAPGALTGSTWVNCEWTGNTCDIKSGGNQDDVRLINCRLTVSSGGMALYLAGSNFTWDGGFIYFTNLYNEGGIKALFQIDNNYTCAFRNIFLETNTSDITHVAWFKSPQCNAVFENIHLRVDDSGQSSALVAFLRGNVEGWADERHPQVMLKNIYADYDNPDWKLLDLFVGSTAGSNDFFSLTLEGCDGFEVPFFQWASGSGTVTRDTVYIHGVHRGLQWHHAFRQSQGNNTPSLQKVIQGHDGVPLGRRSYTTASGTSPRSDIYTLPGSGVYLVNVSGVLTDDKNHMGNGTWLVHFYDGTNDTLTTEQIGNSKFSMGSSLQVNSLTLSNPTEAGLLTASLGWGSGGSHTASFRWRVRRLTNFNELGD